MPPPPAVLLKTCCNRTLCVCERDVCNLPTTFNAKPAGKDGEKVQTTRLLLRFYAPEIPLGFEDSTSGRNCDSLENRDPDSVVLCVLAADHEEDVALQIHFTLLQSFCCNSGITILQVSGIQRLHQLLGAADVNKDQDERKDLHCLLVTNPQANHCRLQEVGAYCQESLRPDQWVPTLILQER
uniref:Ribosomal protein L7Ae/L30e/S12e/Gadd45 domain-containing protein n=1 Tax=Oryzias latipes TaxID=8090 RepID=A0A3B3IBD7_ORYLA